MFKSMAGILEEEAKITGIIKDLRARISVVFGKYSGDKKQIIRLPDYEVLSRDAKLRYNISQKLIDQLDELNELKLRVGLVSRALGDLKFYQVTGSEYNLVLSFKTNLERYSKELTDVKFDIQDLIKTVNSKLRLIDSFNWSVD